MILPKPDSFTPEGLPPNTVDMRATFWQKRALMVPVVQKVHTNAASGIATNQSSKNWLEADPQVNTCPHYQVQRDGRAAKFLPTNRRGLGNATVVPGTAAFNRLSAADRASILAHGQIRNWSTCMETSDLGYGPGKPGDASGFSDEQIPTVAGILAYDSILWGIPLAPNQVGYWMSATDGHTWVHDYPFTTLFPGKTCPGWKKVEQMQTTVLPLAIQIRAEWMGTTVPTDPGIPPDINLEGDEDMYLGIYRGPDNSANPAIYELWNNGRKVWISDPGMWAGAENLCRLAGKPVEAQILDTNTWSAFGIVDGPVPAGYDVYGNRVA